MYRLVEASRADNLAGRMLSRPPEDNCFERGGPRYIVDWLVKGISKYQMTQRSWPQDPVDRPVEGVAERKLLKRRRKHHSTNPLVEANRDGNVVRKSIPLLRLPQDKRFERGGPRYAVDWLVKGFSKYQVTQRWRPKDSANRLVEVPPKSQLSQRRRKCHVINGLPEADSKGQLLQRSRKNRFANRLLETAYWLRVKRIDVRVRLIPGPEVQVEQLEWNGGTRLVEVVPEGKLLQ